MVSSHHLNTGGLVFGDGEPSLVLGDMVVDDDIESIAHSIEQVAKDRLKEQKSQRHKQGKTKGKSERSESEDIDEETKPPAKIRPNMAVLRRIASLIDVAEEAPERLWGLGRPCPGESELLAELFAS